MNAIKKTGWLTAVALLATAATHLFGQADTTQISGFVRDATESVIPGAAVTITNEATQLTREVQTNESGYYVALALPPGYYTVAAESEGFKRTLRTQNKLDSNIAMQVDLRLELGEVTESIEVAAEAIQLQSETATVGRLVEETQIKNIVLNGRNPLFLALLKPGVTSRSSIGGFSFGLTSGSLSINGSRRQDNIISFDGAVNMRTRSNGTSIGTADLETVQEIQILTANYNAEYGRGMAGQIRFVTKSGSSEFHGSLYEYFRNNALDANTWSRNRAGQERQAERFNQFGYVLSGPVVLGRFNRNRNKMFWLWSQEWVTRRRERTSIITVPSLPMRNGDFSELLSPDNTFFGRVRNVIDPDSGEPFANNIVPQARLSRNGRGFLAAYPDPVPGFLQGTNNFIQTRPQPADQRKDTVSIDYNMAHNQNLRFRLQNYNYFEPEAFRGGTDRATRTIDRPNRTYTANHIWTVSPTLINEFLASISYDRVYLEVPVTSRLDRGTYGIDYPYIYPERKEIPIKIPTINIQNMGRVDGGPYPAFSSGPIYQISNNITKIVGNHSIKFGGRFERAGQNDFDQINVSGVPGGTNNQNGRFVFDDRRLGAPSTGVAVANAAVGLFSTYAEIGQRAYTPYRGIMGEFFVQDSWKPTPDLRIELGVRYSVMTPYFYSLWRNMAVFDPASYDPSRAAVMDPQTGNVIGGDRYNGVRIPGKGWPEAAFGRVAIADSGEFDHLFTGGTKYWGQVQTREFQPRIGIAYKISDRSVVRAGLGRYLARPGVADNVFLGGNPPFQPMVSVSAGLADNPGAGEATGFPQFFMTQDPVYRIPASYMWNISFQREVGFKTLLEVGYVGRTATHMERVRDINQLPLGTLLRPELDGVNPNYLRQYKGFANIILGENAARSEYNGLQFNLTRRFSDGLSFGAAYTYSSSWDNADNRRDRIWNSADDTNFWGPADYDVRHALVLNWVYEVPLMRNSANRVAKAVVGGWTVSGVMQYQTGFPRTVGRNSDYAGIGDNSFQPWEVGGDPKLPRSQRGFSQGRGDDVYFFRTTTSGGDRLFNAPAAGTFSQTQHRNQYIRQPNRQSWNLGIFKDFSVSEGQTVTLRCEMFNFPNHPNFSSVNTNPVSATFGKVTSKTSNRNLQLSLRYSF
ncbi:MAG: carboxypeptidase regulatory-like domain-containing protein [Bryobacterales bacterium]|nr:carboxypeptidase regulatory-like domain-containing protein [Bryobacterales bacterium]